MDEHNIPALTFPTSTMDKSSLECIALAPRKFRHLIRHPANSDGLYPRTARILVNHLSSSELDNQDLICLSDYKTILMAPGGRFFVTLREAHSKTSAVTLVQLWDLGIVTVPDRITSIASVVLKVSAKKIQHPLFSPSPDDKTFYFSYGHIKRSSFFFSAVMEPLLNCLPLATSLQFLCTTSRWTPLPSHTTANWYWQTKGTTCSP